MNQTMLHGALRGGSMGRSRNEPMPWAPAGRIQRATSATTNFNNKAPAINSRTATATHTQGEVKSRTAYVPIVTSEAPILAHERVPRVGTLSPLAALDTQSGEAFGHTVHEVRRVQFVVIAKESGLDANAKGGLQKKLQQRRRVETITRPNDGK